MLASFSQQANQLHPPADPMADTDPQEIDDDLDQLLDGPPGPSPPRTPRNGRSPGSQISPLSDASGLNSPTKQLPTPGYKPFKARPLPKTTHEPAPPPKDMSLVDSPSRVKTYSPPKLRTASRSKQREVRAKEFSKLAAQAHKKKLIHLKEVYRQKNTPILSNSAKLRAILTVPDKPFLFAGQRKWEESQARLRAMREAEEEKHKQMADSFRAREYKPSTPSPPKEIHTTRRPTTVDPFNFRSDARHAVYQAKLEEKLQKETEAELAGQQFHPRPVPKSTYEPETNFQLSDETKSRMEKVRQSKLENLERMEKEKVSSPEFHPRPVPETTYKSPERPSARAEESFRRVTDQHKKKLEEMKREEEKKAEEEEYHYKPRPVPPTTYKPHPINPSEEEKALRDAALARERKFEELQREEKIRAGDADFQYKPLPVPKTTYEPPAKTSPRFEQSLIHINSIRQQKLNEIRKTESERKRESEFHYKSRPVPKTTYDPKPISPRDLQLEKRRAAGEGASSVRSRTRKSPSKISHTHSADDEGGRQFHARPVPKTTYEPKLIAPQPISERDETKAPAYSTGKEFRHYHCGEDMHSSSKHSSPPARSFKARPVPATTYKPVTPKMRHPIRKPAEPKSAPPFRARPVPKTTYTASTVTSSSATPKKPTSSFRPITTPQKTPTTSTKINTGSSTFRARPAPKTTYGSKLAESTPTPTRSRTSPRRVATTPKSSSPPKRPSPRKTPSRSPKVPSSVVVKKDSHPREEDSPMLEEILSDDHAAEITFTKVDSGDDEEVARINGIENPWHASPNKDEHDSTLDDLLGD